jgi:hypothetical protein
MYILGLITGKLKMMLAGKDDFYEI